MIYKRGGKLWCWFNYRIHFLKGCFNVETAWDWNVNYRFDRAPTATSTGQVPVTCRSVGKQPLPRILCPCSNRARPPRATLFKLGHVGERNTCLSLIGGLVTRALLSGNESLDSWLVWFLLFLSSYSLPLSLSLSRSPFARPLDAFSTTTPVPPPVLQSFSLWTMVRVDDYARLDFTFDIKDAGDAWIGRVWRDKILIGSFLLNCLLKNEI